MQYAFGWNVKIQTYSNSNGFGGMIFTRKKWIHHNAAEDLQQYKREEQKNTQRRNWDVVKWNVVKFLLNLISVNKIARFLTEMLWARAICFKVFFFSFHKLLWDKWSPGKGSFWCKQKTQELMHFEKNQFF